jgi:hypothetical protein
MAADYGHFADGSSGRLVCHELFPRASRPYSRLIQLTPSFFCRLDDDVVYWNTSRLSGNT